MELAKLKIVEILNLTNYNNINKWQCLDMGGDIMNEDGFRKLYWGFLFIMIDFRIQGVDILPDIIGYILFAVGFGILALHSIHFSKARNLNIPMIILSIFSIYEVPAQNGGVQFSPLGFFGILISIASLILNLLVIYNLFMGIKDMAEERGQMDLYTESNKMWNQYLMLQIAGIFMFVLIFIPLLGLISIIALLIASIILTVVIMGFIKRCGMYL